MLIGAMVVDEGAGFTNEVLAGVELGIYIGDGAEEGDVDGSETTGDPSVGELATSFLPVLLSLMSWLIVS